MPVKKAVRKPFVKIFDILDGLDAFFAQLDGQESRFLTSLRFSFRPKRANG